METDLQTDSAPIIKGPTHDQEFFYEAIFIQVEDTLFCIPREQIDVPGTTFAQMFADGSPSISPHGPEGSHRSNPLILEGIDSKAFRSFLRVAWKRETRVRMNEEEWPNVLRLATLWNFEAIIPQAQIEVYRISRNDAFAMINLGQEYKIKDWIIRGYAILSDPGTMMSLNALPSKGLSHITADIFNVREAMRFYTQHDLRLRTGSPAYGREFECFSCKTVAPQCRLGTDSYLQHHVLCDPESEKVTWCKCKKLLFPHPGAMEPFDSMVKLLIEEVFKDELKHY